MVVRRSSPEPPGGFARKKPEAESAFEFMRKTVAASPGQVTIVAIGPLINVAMAIRQEPASGGSA